MFAKKVQQIFPYDISATSQNQPNRNLCRHCHRAIRTTFLQSSFRLHQQKFEYNFANLPHFKLCLLVSEIYEKMQQVRSLFQSFNVNITFLL